MDYQEIKQKIIELVETNCRIMGLELWGLEFAPGTGGKRGMLRVYVDAPGGVTVDQCAELSHQLSVVLDVEDLIPGSYNLEVSSPGLYRKFFHPEQMRSYTGHKVKVTLKQPREGRRNFTGTLNFVHGNRFSVQTDTQTSWDFDWEEIGRLKLAE